MPLKKKTTRTAPASKIRIISGKWRGRKLPVPEAPGLRPTGDRMRETLFNWLAPYIASAHCLDAFAGTGALGFEALSRGAASTHFVEQQHEVAQHLTMNAQLLECKDAYVQCSNFNQWQANSDVRFDIVFIDPPFNDKLWLQAIEYLANNIPLADDALIYIETPKSEIITTPPSWEVYKQKTAGQVNATLYKISSETNPTIPR